MIHRWWFIVSQQSISIDVSMLGSGCGFCVGLPSRLCRFGLRRLIERQAELAFVR